MNRRHLIAGLCAGLLLPQIALADGYADRIVRQLRRQGYSGISVSNTWLGRTRIVGRSDAGDREIIIDPRTGEILRDLFSVQGSESRIFDDDDDDGRESDDNDRDDDRDDDRDRGGNSGRGNNNDDEDDDEPDNEND